MARPSKINISSFPLDVNFFDNKIMVRISGEYGIKGEIIALKLLCTVYKQGYYLKWTIDERALLIRCLPGINPETLDQVLNSLLEWNFFNKELFLKTRILTSLDIQKNYFKAIKRRISIHQNSFPYLLLDPQHPNNVSVNQNEITVNRNIDFIDENEIRVIKSKYNYNKNGFTITKTADSEETEKEFLYSETDIKEYNKSKNTNTNINIGNNIKFSADENAINDNNVSKLKSPQTINLVSVDKNQSTCKQKFSNLNNDNPHIDNINEQSDNKNPVNVCNNGERENSNKDIASDNPSNIIYNVYNNNSSSRSSRSNKESVSEIESGEQKGKEGMTEFERNLQELLKQQVWIESICMKHHIDIDQIPNLINKYKIHCIADGLEVINSGINQLKTHFSHWLPYRDINNQNISAKNYGNTDKKQTSRDKRRGTPANCQKEKDYYTSF